MMKIYQIGEDEIVHSSTYVIFKYSLCMIPSFAKRLSFGNIDKGIVGITRTEIEMGK